MSSSPDKNVQDSNPLKTDPELKGLLKELDDINNAPKFRRWKGSFLRRFETFIEQKGIDPATKEYSIIQANLQGFHKTCVKLEKAVDTGALTKTNVSVKGRNALNEVNKSMTDVIERMITLLPGTGADEKKMGYNKFQLGAVLIRDNFMAYDLMESTQAILQRLKDDPLGDVADRQIIDQIDYYMTNIQRFCDVMASLALYDVMQKCRRFGGGDGDVLIFVDAKTGYVGEISRSAAINAKLLTITKSDTGKESIEEAVFGEEKLSLIHSIKEKLQI
jgi:hypothetical protein